jgi:hypothetical protein
MNLEELTASGLNDAEDYFREYNRMYGTSELKISVITNPNDMSTTVETSGFVEGLDQLLTAGKIPGHNRSYSRLGSKQMLADYNINCILPVDSPETL